MQACSQGHYSAQNGHVVKQQTKWGMGIGLLKDDISQRFTKCQTQEENSHIASEPT